MVVVKVLAIPPLKMPQLDLIILVVVAGAPTLKTQMVARKVVMESLSLHTYK